METDTDDIRTQLAIWGWAVTTGPGAYPTAHDQWNAEREVAILEGVHLDGMHDATIVDLFRTRILRGDREPVAPPMSWALAGYGAWRQTRGDDT